LLFWWTISFWNFEISIILFPSKLFDAIGTDFVGSDCQQLKQVPGKQIGIIALTNLCHLPPKDRAKNLSSAVSYTYRDE
jgi:hypothetical protein